MRIQCLVITIITIAYADTTTTYRWPFVTGQGADTIISNFGDYRPLDVTLPHFHEGIDIRADDTLGKTYDVISVTSGFKVIAEPTLKSYGWVITTQYYTNDTSAPVDPAQGSIHMHMLTKNDSLANGMKYINTFISHGTTFWRDHLHLQYEILGGNSYSKDPFYITRLPIQVPDDKSPVLYKIYVDDWIEGDAIVDSINFLGYYFDSLYNSSGSFIALKLPDPTPDDDLDDPHIMISGNRKVRFVLQGWDHFNRSDDYGTPYIVASYIGLNTILYEQACYMVRFDSLLYTDVYQSEDVYYPTAPCSSAFGASQYYRLYQHDYSNDGLPGCIITDKTIVDTTGIHTEIEIFNEGMHRLRIYAEDRAGHYKTGDIHFYLRKSDYIDVCRGFKE